MGHFVSPCILPLGFPHRYFLTRWVKSIPQMEVDEPFNTRAKIVAYGREQHELQQANPVMTGWTQRGIAACRMDAAHTAVCPKCFLRHVLGWRYTDIQARISRTFTLEVRFSRVQAFTVNIIEGEITLRPSARSHQSTFSGGLFSREMKTRAGAGFGGIPARV